MKKFFSVVVIIVCLAAFLIPTIVFADESQTDHNDPVVDVGGDTIDDNMTVIPQIEGDTSVDIPKVETPQQDTLQDEKSIAIEDIRTTLNILVYIIIPFSAACFIIYKILGFFMKHYITF